MKCMQIENDLWNYLVDYIRCLDLLNIVSRKNTHFEILNFCYLFSKQNLKVLEDVRQRQIKDML